MIVKADKLHLGMNSKIHRAGLTEGGLWIRRIPDSCKPSKVFRSLGGLVVAVARHHTYRLLSRP